MKRLIIVLVLLSAPFPAALAEDELQRFAHGMVNDFELAMTGRIDVAMLADRLRAWVDFPAIARGVLGQHRVSLSPSQRAEFQQVFEASLVQLLADAVTGMRDYALRPGNPTLLKDTRAQLPLEVMTDGQRFQFDFSLVLGEQGWRVRNVLVNGVNIGLTYRNQFHALMLEHNGVADAAILDWVATPDLDG